MRKMTKALTLAAASAALAITASGPALADSGQADNDSSRITRSVVVAYGDLNLASEAGAKRLERRIRSAARTVCGPRPNRGLVQQQDYKHCFSVAMAGGKKAMVTLVAQAENGAEFAQNAALPIK